MFKSLQVTTRYREKSGYRLIIRRPDLMLPTYPLLLPSLPRLLGQARQSRKIEPPLAANKCGSPRRVLCCLPDYAECRKSVVLRLLTSFAIAHSTANPAPRDDAKRQELFNDSMVMPDAFKQSRHCEGVSPRQSILIGGDAALKKRNQLRINIPCHCEDWQSQSVAIHTHPNDKA